MESKWVTEEADGYGQTIETTEHLFSKKSKFQQIDIYRTRKLKTMLMLDGIIQLTGFDEFAYHEMMAHLPFYTHHAPIVLEIFRKTVWKKSGTVKSTENFVKGLKILNFPIAHCAMGVMTD